MIHVNVSGCITVVATCQFELSKDIGSILKHCPALHAVDFCNLAILWVSVQQDHVFQQTLSYFSRYEFYEGKDSPFQFHF